MEQAINARKSGISYFAVEKSPIDTVSYSQLPVKRGNETMPREAGFIPPWFVAHCGDMLSGLEIGWSKPRKLKEIGYGK